MIKKAKRIIRLLLVASGSGTDAQSIMEAWAKGFLETANFIIEIVGLISTERGAGCLKRAENFRVPVMTIDYNSFKKTHSHDPLVAFRWDMDEAYKEFQPDLIFLVGCKRWVPVPEFIPVCNIHPAEKFDHGGYTMYGLEPHISVLRKIMDQVRRRVADIEDRFFTYPTVHYIPFSPVGDRSKKYDRGSIIVQATVEIPQTLVEKLCSKKKKHRIGRAAKELQKHVLPYEWDILPGAVKAAARDIVNGNRKRLAA